MGVVANEPSMEDILSSIKRIIADGSDRPSLARAPRRRIAGQDEDDVADADRDGDEGLARDPAVLELTDMVEEPFADAIAARAVQQESAPVPPPQPAAAMQEQILSDVSAQAARQSLSQLSSLLVRPQEGEANTLEGLVREMLRPMLKDWLETNLPHLVEGLVKKEIDRIVGRLG